MAKSVLLFSRLLVVELAHQTRALSLENVGSPPRDCFGRDPWDVWRHAFASLDRALNPGENETQPDSPRLFATDPFFERYGPGREALHNALEAAGRLACEPPYETLSRTYERLLTYEPCLSAAGHPVLRSCRRLRRASGSFYTPLPIARLTVEETLRPILDGETCQVPRIMDPAMGIGAFLVEAARYLHEAFPHMSPNGRVPSTFIPSTSTGACVRPTPPMTRTEIAEECLHGVDLDPLAVQLAIHALWLETGARPAVLARHLHTGNLLSHAAEKPCRTYDAVVGNPPWGPEHDWTKSGSERQRLGRDSIDRFKLFLRLGATLSSGTVGMIVPQAVLAQATHGDIRALLLERFDPYSVVDLGNDAFPAAAPACALVFGPKPGPPQVRHAQSRGLPRHPVWSSIPRSHCSEGGFMLAGTEVLQLYARLRERHPALGELASHMRVRDVGINYNRAAVARRVLYCGSEPDDPRDHPRFRGRDFDRYTSVRRGGWLRHDALSQLTDGEHLSLSWSTYLLPEKIVLRQTADRLVATLDRRRMAMGRSVLALTAESDLSLRAVLACLNSRLLTVLYRALAGEEGRLLPQVKVGRLTALPIPAVCTLSIPSDIVRDAERAITPASEDSSTSLLRRASDDPIFAWASLDRLAERLLRAEGRDDRLDALIDRLVCVCYGLTPQETEMIFSLISDADGRTARRSRRE